MKRMKSVYAMLIVFLLMAGCDLFKGTQKVSLPDHPVLNTPPADLKAVEAKKPVEQEAKATVEPEAGTPVGDNTAPAAASAEVAAPAVDADPVAGETGKAPAAKVAAPVERDGIKSRFSGSVTTRNKAAIAFKVSGFIEKILVEVGQNCHKGDILAKLDPRDYKTSRDMAQAQLSLAKVALTNATQEFNRENSLYKQKASTDSSFDRLQAGLDKAKIDVQMADLRLQQATQALDDTILKAPYECVVTKQMKNEHENVGVGSPVLEIYNTADLEFQFSVPENLAGKIKIGDKMDVKIPSTGYSAKLDVIRLVPVITDVSRTFLIVVRAPVNDARVVGGLYAEAVMP